MFGGINPKKIQQMMSKMGIQQEDIDAKRVIIESEDKNIVIQNPQVAKINMSGTETFQITGDVSEEEADTGPTEEDIKQVMEKTGKDEKEAKSALEKSGGDLAEAILELSS